MFGMSAPHPALSPLREARELKSAGIKKPTAPFGAVGFSTRRKLLTRLVEFFFDTCSFAGEFAQVVQLGFANVAAAFDFNAVDHR